MAKENYTVKTLGLLKDLKKKYPTWDLSQHIAGALEGYSDIWGIKDKELFFAFEKYSQALELDHNAEDITTIIAGAMDLKSLMAQTTDDSEEEDY